MNGVADSTVTSLFFHLAVLSENNVWDVSIMSVVSLQNVNACANDLVEVTVMAQTTASMQC